MNLFKTIWSKLRSLGTRRVVKREIDEELRFHIEQRTAENIAAGMSSAEAAREALKRFGNLQSVREECRETRGASFGEQTLQDIRFAIRQLQKNPGFTAVAVLTLALGIGANTAIFSLIDGILLRPVMCRAPEALVGVYQHDSDKDNHFQMFSYPDFADLRSSRGSVFSDLFAFSRASVGVQGDLTREVPVSLVSANYFTALGVSPVLGRTFSPDEETSESPVVVLSYSFWKKRGADPAIVGTTLKLTRGNVTVIGVMPDGFTGAQMQAPDVFLPLGIPGSLISGAGSDARRLVTNRGDRRFMLMGRLKPGFDLSNVAGPLSVLSHQFAIPDPAKPQARTLVCTPPSRFNFSNMPDRKKQGLAQIAGFALGLSVLVLAIACLNLANMMLARNAARRKEIAVRLALGASRRRILGQLMTEGLLLALLGGLAGLLVSAAATGTLKAFVYSGAGMPSDFPVFNFGLDWRVLLTLLFLVGLATVFFALGPAWKLARLDFNSDLKQHSGEESRRLRFGRFGARDLLAVGQMAFTLALLVAAALFSRSAVNAYVANPGFEFGSNFYAALDPGLTGATDPQAKELQRAATEALSALPGVESVSTAMDIPFGNGMSGCAVQLAGAPPPLPDATTLAEGKQLFATYNVVGADYFRTLGIRLLRGREFEHREEQATNGQPVAIISQNLADKLWPGQDPLGRSIQFPETDPRKQPKVMTVVGLVPAIQWRLFKEDDEPSQVYIPPSQEFHAAMKLHVRVAPGIAPEPLMTEARDALHRLDANLPLTEVRTLAAMHRDGPMMRVMRLGSMLFGCFGVGALLLSALGIYGLKAYSVARRTREIGIRMALGANRRNVVGLILRESIWLAGLGLGLGLLLALAVGKLAGSFLYHVPSTDPVTFVLAPPFLLAVTLLACWLPARRAARVNPMEALRSE